MCDDNRVFFRLIQRSVKQSRDLSSPCLDIAEGVDEVFGVAILVSSTCTRLRNIEAGDCCVRVLTRSPNGSPYFLMFGPVVASFSSLGPLVPKALRYVGD